MTERADSDTVEERIRQAVAQERAACIRLAEQHLRDLQHGHGVHGERVILSLIHELENRGREARDEAGERGDPAIEADRERI